jgi:quercetin dioxygenase-like cupin family protein
VELQVLEYELAAAERLELEPAHRVIYRIAEESAEYSAGAATLTGPAHVLSFELVGVASPEAKLSAPVELEPSDGDRLIRLDRVSFPPGGVAYLHVHRGPGIRVLLEGEIRIDTDGTSTGYGPLEAWFESGPVPVFAAASETAPTSFVRCMVLPAELQGQRSITYVRDEDADKPKLQQYRVFVDEPLVSSSVST